MTSPRDYKASRPRMGAGALRANVAGGRLRFAAGAVFGLSLGLCAAVAVHLYHRAQAPADATATADAAREAPAAAAEGDEIHYDFFDLLPGFKLEIPPPDGDADDIPAARAGSRFILQAGAFKEREQAQRQRQQLVGMGYRAGVHKFRAAGADWHRVWIGPYPELARANEARLALKEKGIETLLTGH